MGFRRIWALPTRSQNCSFRVIAFTFPKKMTRTPCKLIVVVAVIAQDRSHGIFCRTNYAPVPRVRYCAQAQLASKAAAASKTSISLL